MVAQRKSKKRYNDVLFVFDIGHTPYGYKVWPPISIADAPNWPCDSEIDVIDWVRLL
jgi:hypothetical protein